MRNKNEGIAILHHLVHDDEKFVHFLWGKNGSWLVKNEQRCAAIKRLDNFNPLLLTNGELPDIGIGINFQTVDTGQFHCELDFDYIKNKTLRNLAFYLATHSRLFWPMIYVAAKK